MIGYGGGDLEWEDFEDDPDRCMHPYCDDPCCPTHGDGPCGHEPDCKVWDHDTPAAGVPG